MSSTRNAESRDSNRNFKSHSPNRKKSLRGVVNRPLKSLSPGLNRGDPHQNVPNRIVHAFKSQPNRDDRFGKRLQSVTFILYFTIVWATLGSMIDSKGELICITRIVKKTLCSRALESLWNRNRIATKSQKHTIPGGPPLIKAWNLSMRLLGQLQSRTLPNEDRLVWWRTAGILGFTSLLGVEHDWTITDWNVWVTAISNRECLRWGPRQNGIARQTIVKNN